MLELLDLYRMAVENAFQENFGRYKDKRIILYGTGDIARFILEKYPDYNIIGFLDGSISHGTKLGKPVFSYEEAVAQHPDIIIVAAKKDHIKTIYDRICYMCYTNHIPLYAIDGRNLFTAFGYGGLSAHQESYGDLCESSLKEEILRHDTIGFEIFDVLLMRKALIKEDFFKIVGDRLKRCGANIPEYCSIRRALDHEVMALGGSLYDIYDKLAARTGIDRETARLALETELAVENNLLCCRDKIKELYSFAISSGKKVYLLSDTYLPADFVRKILDKHGITQYEGILLSSEYKKAKAQGLYDTLKALSGEGSFLHIIARNDDSDYPVAEGADVFKIPRPYDLLLMSPYRHLKYSFDAINHRSMAGLLAARLFSDPFALYKREGRPEIDSIYDFGYTFVAPLITKYVLWIIEEAIKGQYTDLLFAARDGFLTHKLYSFATEKLKLNAPRGIYFQTSRILCTSSVVSEEEDILWNANIPHANAPERMLAERFNLDEEDIEPYDHEKYPDVLTYVLHHKERIYKKSKQIRSNYLTYMRSLGLKENGRYAFVDFVSSGTCQQTLSEFAFFDIEGLYFCKYWNENDDKLKLPGRSLFENICKENVYCSYAYEKYLILETIMTSFQPSLASMDEKGQPIYRKETRTEEELQYVEEIHQAIEDYFQDYISNLYVPGDEINKHFTDTIFRFREKAYTNEHLSVFDTLTLHEDFGQWRMLLDRNY